MPTVLLFSRFRATEGRKTLLLVQAIIKAIFQPLNVPPLGIPFVELDIGCSRGKHLLDRYKNSNSPKKFLTIQSPCIIVATGGELMKALQLSLDTFYSLVDEKVSENNKIEFKRFSFLDGKVTPETKRKT